jgi:hypothetical protein
MSIASGPVGTPPDANPDSTATAGASKPATVMHAPPVWG